MPLAPKSAGPELDRDLAFQHRTWLIQRIGWGVIALILFCALLGLFGRGPLSQTTIREPSLPISVTYERFGRYQSASELRVHIDTIPMHDQIATMWLSKDYVSRMEIQHVVPIPEREEVSATGMMYVFRVATPKEGIDIFVTVQAQTIGFVTGRIGFDESQALPFRQWIYP